MEVVWFIANHALSLALGFGGGMAYHRYRLWKIRRYAPSAEVTGFHVSLAQQHYDRLRNLGKKEDDVMYMIVNRDERPD